MKRLKIEYSNKEYIYDILEYVTNGENTIGITMKDPKDRLIKWVRNNRDDTAKRISCNITINDDGNIKEYKDCVLKSLNYFVDDDLYTIAITHK